MANGIDFVCPECGELISTTQSIFPIDRGGDTVYQRFFVEHFGPHGEHMGIMERRCPMSGAAAYPAEDEGYDDTPDTDSPMSFGALDLL